VHPFQRERVEMVPRFIDAAARISPTAARPWPAPLRRRQARQYPLHLCGLPLTRAGCGWDAAPVQLGCFEGRLFFRFLRGGICDFKRFTSDLSMKVR
jgi:hypothetical protein